MTSNWQPVHDSLTEMAKGVWEELNGVFRFRYVDTQGRVYCLEDPAVQQLYLTLQMHNGASETQAKEELRKRLALERNEESWYVGHIFRPNAGADPIDYMIFVPDASKANQIAMGEEVTHGEHGAQHIRDCGSYDEFSKRFSSTAKEFIGLLGAWHVAKNHRCKIAIQAPEIREGDVDQYDLEHWFGYGLARQLVNSGREVPSQELFHAPDQKVMWGILREVIKDPYITMPSREPGVNDALFERARSTLTECGLFGQDFRFEE